MKKDVKGEIEGWWWCGDLKVGSIWLGLSKYGFDQVGSHFTVSAGLIRWVQAGVLWLYRGAGTWCGLNMAWVDRGRSGFQKFGSVCDNIRPLCTSGWVRCMGSILRVGSGSLGVKEVSVGCSWRRVSVCVRWDPCWMNVSGKRRKWWGSVAMK